MVARDRDQRAEIERAEEEPVRCVRVVDRLGVERVEGPEQGAREGGPAPRWKRSSASRSTPFTRCRATFTTW
jgi:hypothetical protein